MNLTTATIFSALDKYAALLHPERGDEKDRHVSDVPMCDRATWARLRGKYKESHDADTLRKFTLGFAVEEHVLDALAMDNVVVERQVRVAYTADHLGIVGSQVNEDYVAPKHVIVGHPDGVGDDFVLEVKSTEFMLDRKTWTRIVPATEAQLQHHYKIQCASYALALKKPRCIVVIVCRASGLVAVVEFDPQNYRVEIIERSMAVLAIGEDMPEPTLHLSTINAKGVSWLCKYCPYTACPKNVKENN